MTKRLALLVPIAALGLLAVMPSSSQAAPPRGFDASPVLHLSFDTVTIAAELVHTSVTIHASGAVDWTETRENGPARILRAVVAPEDLGELHRALQAGRIGVERGGCGEAAPDGPVEYEITWYGKESRYNSFRVGGNPSGCAAGTRDMIYAISDFLLKAATHPEKQVFPRVARPGS